jgi:hypothetical protein
VSCCREWWKMKNEYVKLIKFFRFYWNQKWKRLKAISVWEGKQNEINT